jgi:hypothetical protein
VQQQQLAEWWAQRFPTATSSSSSSSSSCKATLASTTTIADTTAGTAAGGVNASGCSDSNSSSSSSVGSTTLAELESALQQRCSGCREQLAQQQAVQLAAADAMECTAMPSMLAQAAAAIASPAPEVRPLCQAAFTNSDRSSAPVLRLPFLNSVVAHFDTVRVIARPPTNSVLIAHWHQLSCSKGSLSDCMHDTKCQYVLFCDLLLHQASASSSASSDAANEAVRLAQALLQQQYTSIGQVYSEVQHSVSIHACGHTKKQQQQQQQQQSTAVVSSAVSSAEVESALQQSLKLVHAGETTAI